MDFRSQIRFNPKSTQGMVMSMVVSYTSLLVVDGNPNVVYLWSNIDDRKLNLNWTDGRWGSGCLVAGVRKSYHFPAPLLSNWGWVCLSICLYQPPSILPISFSGSDKAIYFLFSSEFISQEI